VCACDIIIIIMSGKKQKVSYSKGGPLIEIDSDIKGDEYNLEQIICYSIGEIVDKLFNYKKETGEYDMVYNIKKIKPDYNLKDKFIEIENSYDFIPFFNPLDKDKNGHDIILMFEISPYFCIDETKTRIQIKLLKGKGVPDSRIPLIKEEIIKQHQYNNPGALSINQYINLPDFFPYVHFNVDLIPDKKTTIYRNNINIYSISTILDERNKPLMNMSFIQNCISHLMNNINITSNSTITFSYVIEGIKLNLFISIED